VVPRESAELSGEKLPSTRLVVPAKAGTHLSSDGFAQDDEAERLGVTRQSVIKTWIAEKIDASYARTARAGGPAKKPAKQLAEPRGARYRAKKRRR